MNSLAAPPQPMTAAQRWMLWVTSAVVALTRLWAASASLWDWDEAQFALALREYDVALHQPHPPGFPLFIGLANVVDLFLPAFTSLQVIVIVSACALFPLAFFVSRELRFPFATAYGGALLFVFFPNVWFFGGTGFSDVPGLALLLAACVLLLRGCRNERSYYAGALVLGLAAAIRPQALIVGCAPALVASWHRVRRGSWRALLFASLIGMVVIAAFYACAAFATSSIEDYLYTLQALREYVRKVDSFLSPDRPPLGAIYRSFFVSPVPGGNAAVAIAAMSLIAVILAAVVPLIRWRASSASTKDRGPAAWSVWLLLAMFLPFNVFGWLMLDINSISRYSVGYALMYAVLAAQAALWLSRISGKGAPYVAVIAIALLAGRFAWWTLPALQEARANPSPPVAAMRWADTHLGPDARLYVHASLRPFVLYELPHRQIVLFDKLSELQLGPVGREEWYLAEGTSMYEGAHEFRREHGRIFDVVRRRYFEVSIVPLTALVSFGNGWYDEESNGEVGWRWMSGRGEALLPPLAGKARLALNMSIPHELIARKPTLTITLNGNVIDRFAVTTNEVKKSWTVDSRADGWNALVVETDRVLNPLKEGILADGRDLGLQLRSYRWERF